MKRKLFSLLMLLITAASGAWADNLYLEVNGTSATLMYGAEGSNPYYVAGNGWSGADDAKSNVTAISVDESCKGFAGNSLSNFFKGFSVLNTIDNIENLNTTNVTDMNYLFYDCSSIESLDLSGWNTENVTSMLSMFLCCSNLTTLNISSWNTTSVTDMSCMFDSCSSMESLDLSGWHTDNVTSMNSMFFFCSNLTTLNLSSWNTDNVTDMFFMFIGCTNLKNICVSDGWSTGSVTESDEMFEYCTNLPNWDGTTDKTHANTDAGGYLSLMLKANEGATNEYWATFYSTTSNYQASEGTQVFKVKLTDTSINMTPIADRIVMNGQGVVLKASTAEGINLTPTNETSSADYSDNSLQGTTTQITNPGNAYVLNYKEVTGAGFYKLKETGIIGANKAYLTYSAPANARGYFSFYETTGIEIPTDGCSDATEIVVYDLQGRRVSQPTKGLYIVNGNKVFINK